MRRCRATSGCSGTTVGGARLTEADGLLRVTTTAEELRSNKRAVGNRVGAILAKRDPADGEIVSRRVTAVLLSLDGIG